MYLGWALTKMEVPTKVFIGNLPEDCPVQELREQLENFGKIVEFDIVLNYAFAHYKNSEDAKDVVECMNGKEFMGKKLKVELSRSKVRQKPGMGGKKECFRCGAEGHWSKTCPQNPNKGEDDYERGGSSSRRDYYSGRDRYDDRDPYGGRDPYDDYYYRSRYPPHPMDRYHPYSSLYERRRFPPLPRDVYSDPYSRPPPDYYASRSLGPRVDPLDLYERFLGRLLPPPMSRSAGRNSPSSRPHPRPRPLPY